MTSGYSISSTVKSLVERAIGGILFIDEAYSLANDAKGKEALDALIPYLENRRDDFICIMAGYKKDMANVFLLNEGFSSRFPHHFHFDNYKADELSDIYSVIKDEYKLNAEDDFLPSLMGIAVENGLTSGNGRWVRNLFEQTLMEQSNRLFLDEMDGTELTKTHMETIEKVDIIKALSHQCPLTEKDIEEQLAINKKKNQIIR